jgi:hypothetical protein
MVLVKLQGKKTSKITAMDAHEFVYFEVDFDLNNPYQPTDEKIVQMLSSQHPIINEDEEVIITNDVVEVHMRFKDALNDFEEIFGAKA